MNNVFNTIGAVLLIGAIHVSLCIIITLTWNVGNIHQLGLIEGIAIITTIMFLFAYKGIWSLVCQKSETT